MESDENKVSEVLLGNHDACGEKWFSRIHDDMFFFGKFSSILFPAPES